MTRVFDLLVIGGGINGAGIARDAAGRGLDVALVDAGDLGGATSSASTKLIHGGLRYLEFYQFGLVRKALAEREVILDNAPHLSWPQSFVLPHSPEQRPEWMLRAGLWLYDHLAKRDVVPGSTRIDLRQDRAGRALQPQFRTAFRYWDGWIDDARLVIANAQDVVARGGSVITRTRITRATFDGVWTATLADGRALRAKTIVNAAGPWAEHVARTVLGRNDAPALRLVQGSHIVTRRVHLGRDAFMLQQPDGRIIFVIPYEHDFSLIGTTERAVDSADTVAVGDDETEYLLTAVNRYIARPLTPADIVHRYAGVRPLVVDPGKGDRETSRDFSLVAHAGVPALTVVGGKITTYRKLAEAVLAKIAPKTQAWTATAPLPGGDVARLPHENGQDGFKRWLVNLTQSYENYDPKLIKRLGYTLGTAAEPLLANGLGENLGGVFEAELQHFRDAEWATTADDVLWRRTKLGLHLDRAAKARVAAWFGETASDDGDSSITAPTHRFAVPGQG